MTFSTRNATKFARKLSNFSTFSDPQNSRMIHKIKVNTVETVFSNYCLFLPFSAVKTIRINRLKSYERNTFPSAVPNTKCGCSCGHTRHVIALCCMNLLQMTFFSPHCSPIRYTNMILSVCATASLVLSGEKPRPFTCKGVIWLNTGDRYNSVCGVLDRLSGVTWWWRIESDKKVYLLNLGGGGAKANLTPKGL